MELVFATNNPHKLFEVQNLLGDKIRLISLRDIGISDDIPEDYTTLEENALQKARYIYNISKNDCFADDTGLEVEYLNGKPGVYSARYAGEEKNPVTNVAKLLHELNGVSNRNARFRTIIALIFQGKEFIFEGVVNGKIIEKERGHEGFGYDPVFLPNGYPLTFAEMPLNVKNSISHRALAIGKLVDFLKHHL